jgi:hypothetical protein
MIRFIQPLKPARAVASPLSAFTPLVAGALVTPFHLKMQKNYAQNSAIAFVLNVCTFMLRTTLKSAQSDKIF